MPAPAARQGITAYGFFSRNRAFSHDPLSI
jgi:hypothetical protein